LVTLPQHNHYLQKYVGNALAGGWRPQRGGPFPGKLSRDKRR